LTAQIEVEILGESYNATRLAAAPYDPSGLRLRN
jgi:hypothetical protein